MGGFLSLPLEGIRIVAISQYGADLGAEVIKIEDPSTRGDSAREVRPYKQDSDSLFYQSFNRNKKSVTLNLRNPSARDVFHRLVKVSDVVFNNLRGDQPAKLGLNYGSLKSVNPKVVCSALSGFGTTGSKAVEPSYDYMLQAYCGLEDITGNPGTPPTRAGIPVIDLATGFAAALAVMAGLYRVSKTGKGCDADVSLYDVAISMMSYLATWHLNKGFIPQKTEDSSHPTLVPVQNFQTKDGWIVVMCIKEEFWDRLCLELGAGGLVKDPRFRDFEARTRNRHILIPLLKEIFRTKGTAHWLEKLRGKVPSAPGWGRLKEVACPIKISDSSYARRPAPRLGEHTEEILRDLLGYSKEEVDSLREKGAV